MAAAIAPAEAAASRGPVALAERELVLSRVLDAPRRLVFRAWTDQAHLVRWFGRHGSTPTACTLDPRPGGAISFAMRTRDGEHCAHRGVIRELVEPERLAFTFTWDQDGHETLVTVTFADEGDRTRLTIRQAVFDSVEARDAHEGGWSEALERLAAYVAHA